MQGFSVESKTSGISSSSTLWQDLENPYKSCNKANLTPRSPGTKPEKMTNSEDLPRKVSNLAGQGATSNSERNWRQGPTCRRGKDLEDSGTNVGQRRQATGPGWAQASRPRSADPAHSRAGHLPLWPNRHSGYLYPWGQEPHINSFVISRRGAEKRGTPFERGEGRASWLGSP
jgi:hypothetical protein